jgi:hypothetical protein
MFLEWTPQYYFMGLVHYMSPIASINILYSTAILSQHN